ncbi:MAG TPA: hypothetical protein VMF32_17935 [Xanthobacteraceae bacterium]|nr:hypothetical protein [Xanthobacteraceae bacterium]
MLGRTIVMSAGKASNGLATGHQLLLACVASLILALVCVVVVGPAFARTPYDGEWSVVIVTRGGACDASYRFGVQITQGAVINDGGGLATVEGKVAPTGIVKVTVRAGGEWAFGSGHLSKNRGGGVWRGQGNSGTCSGMWLAERRI